MSDSMVASYKDHLRRSVAFDRYPTRYRAYLMPPSEGRAAKKVAPKDTAAHVRYRSEFVAACKAAGVEPSVRQARKYLAKRGRWASSRRVAS